MVKNCSGNFRVSDEICANGERWFWVIGHDFCFPARDEPDAYRILEEKKKEEEDCLADTLEGPGRYPVEKKSYARLSR